MFSLILKEKLNNYVPRLGNYEISQNKSSYNVFSGTGARNGGIAHIYNFLQNKIENDLDTICTNNDID